MMSKVPGRARASADRCRGGEQDAERTAARAPARGQVQRTLGNRIAGLLAELAAPAPVGGAAAQEAARRGLVGASHALPHLPAIQRSFGRHDVGGVAAHSDAAAQEAAETLGAEAFASGEHVAFAVAPDLRTAAHEAAHVVQQRAGIELPGGLDRPGDGFERHADAVAERVVAGQSAEPLLDTIAGSRAAGPAVQRRLTVKARTLMATQTRGRGVTPRSPEGVLAQLVGELQAYERTTEPAEVRRLLTQIRGLVQHWHTIAPTPRGALERRRRDLLLQLESEVERERAQLQVREVYTEQDDPMEFLEAQTQYFAFDVAKDLEAGNVGRPQINAGAESVAVVQDNEMTAAEVAAIRVFSMNDYRYINPAVANDRDWMAINYPNADRAEVTARMQEGAVHAAVMLEGLAKLPPWRGQTFRGERMTRALFDKKYVDAPSVKFGSFASMATVRSVAEEFADGSNKTPADATVSVMVTLDVTYARDIGKLSTLPREQEVLLLPGAEFVVERMKRLRTGRPGAANAPATEWFEVHLRQVR